MFVSTSRQYSFRIHHVNDANSYVLLGLCASFERRHHPFGGRGRGKLTVYKLETTPPDLFVLFAVDPALRTYVFKFKKKGKEKKNVVRF